MTDEIQVKNGSAVLAHTGITTKTWHLQLPKSNELVARVQVAKDIVRITNCFGSGISINGETLCRSATIELPREKKTIELRVEAGGNTPITVIVPHE